MWSFKMEVINKTIKLFWIWAGSWLIVGAALSYSIFQSATLFLIAGVMISGNHIALAKTLSKWVQKESGVFFWASLKFTCLMGSLLVFWAGRNNHQVGEFLMGASTAIVLPLLVGGHLIWLLAKKNKVSFIG